MRSIIVILITALLVITSALTGFSQDKRGHEIHIGDKIPGLTIHGFIKDSSKSVRISDLYKHKLLILDFWATWCAACLNKFPLMDSLQAQFRDKIEIVSIGYQPYATVRKFLQSNSQALPKHFQLTADDKELSYKLFPHRSLPHVVWIDSTGKVVNITDGENLTAGNIEIFLKNRALNVRPKIDRMSFRMDQPFHLRDSSYLGRSLFTNYTPGIGSGIIVTYETDNPHLIDRIFAYNLSIRQLYWISSFYNQAPMNNFSRMILEIRDSLKFMQPSKVSVETYKKSKYASNFDKDNWDVENLYCYELQMPKPYPDKTAFKDMLIDLNRNLNLNGRFENRKVQCYLLKSQKNRKGLKVSHARPNIVYHNFGLEQFLKAQTIGTLIHVLNRGISDSQIIDETGVSDKQVFDFDINNFKIGMTAFEINKLLIGNGLYLVRAERKIPILVISENKRDKTQRDTHDILSLKD